MISNNNGVNSNRTHREFFSCKILHQKVNSYLFIFFAYSLAFEKNEIVSLSSHQAERQKRTELAHRHTRVTTER